MDSRDVYWGRAVSKAPVCGRFCIRVRLATAFVAVNLLPLLAQAQGTLEDDWRALVALYDSTNGNQWQYNDNWSNATDTAPDAQTLDSWYGVTVDLAAGRVTELRLVENALDGSIPPEIGNLTALRYFSLAKNYLLGAIPAEVGNLTELSYLNLWSSQLEGEIPAGFWTLTNLEVLILGDNPELGGTIPPAAGDLTRLDTLVVNWGKVSGTVPLKLGNLVNLQFLDLRQNRLTGQMPVTLTDLSRLTYVNIDGEQELCYPRAAAFQAWLRGVDEVYGPTCSIENLPSHTGARIGCTAGKAAEFYCEGVDLLSHLRRVDMGAPSDILVNDIWGWTDPQTGREYALVGMENSVAIVDVADPENPVYIGTLPSHDSGAVAIWRDMKVYRNHM